MLMQSAGLETIKLRDFLSNLCRSMAASYTDRQGKVTLNVSVEPYDAVIKIDFAIPLGLLVTELATNAYKHAFPSGRHGAIDVSLTVIGAGEASLVVSDNGVGMPAATPLGTVGQQIIAQLVDQLDGEMTMDNRQGTQLTVTFPCPPGLPC
jgi:two-component sensor histidine kinase